MDDLIERAHRGEASARQLARLEAWRAAAPENEQRYRRTVRLLHATAQLRGDLDAHGTVPRAADLLARATPFEHGHVRSPLRVMDGGAGRSGWGRRVPWAIAAAALLLLVLNTMWPSASAPAPTMASAEIVTGAGEITTVQLGDGSVVHLAPSSRLRLGEEGDSRTVTLEGRAFFSIARVDGHQFQVRTRGATATVLGTRFEIETDRDELRLVVVDGRVALQAADNRVEVSAGQTSAVSGRVATQPAAIADASSVLRWTGRFLAFHDTSLDDAAREISSTYGVRVTITDATLARRTVTAVFTGQNLESMLDVLCTIVNAECAVRGDEVTMSPR